MIPFARVLKYGNIVQVYTPNITKMLSPAAFTGNTLMVLDVNGNLWGIGDQPGGVFGLDNVTSQKTWIKIYSNVKNFWCISNSTYCLIQTNDDKFYFSGSDAWTGTSPSSRVSTFTDCTKYFTDFGINKIKDITVYNNKIMVIGTDDILYGMGNNNGFEMGINTSQLLSKLTSLTPNVKKICSVDGNAFWVIKNDGSVWRTGTTSTGILGTGVSRTYVFPWVQYQLPNGETIVDIFNHSNYIGITTKSQTGVYPLYAMGNQFAGQLGNGSSANTDKLNLNPASINVGEDFEYIKVPATNNRGMVYRLGNKIFSCGYNSLGQVAANSTANAVRFTEAIMPPEVKFNSKTSLISANDTSLCIFVDNKLYYAGLAPNGTGSSSMFKEFTLPSF